MILINYADIQDIVVFRLRNKNSNILFENHRNNVGVGSW